MKSNKKNIPNFNPFISEELYKEILENPKKCEEIILKEKILANKINKIVAKHMLKLFKKAIRRKDEI